MSSRSSKSGLILFCILGLFELFLCAKKMVIVSGYYPLQRSKHSPLEYAQWSSRFFLNVNTVSIIYTSPKCAQDFIYFNNISTVSIVLTDEIQLKDVDFENRADKVFVFLTKYPTVDDIPSMQEFKNDFNTWQHMIDPERSIHSPELYKIWNSKPWLVNNVAKRELFPFDTIFFWVDIGTRRNELVNFKNWPSTERLEQLFPLDGRLTIVTIQEMISQRSLTMAGCFFGCQREECKFFDEAVMDEIRSRIKSRRFAGKDQNIYSKIVLQNPQKFKALFLPTVNIIKNLDIWFEPFWIALSDLSTRKRYFVGDSIDLKLVPLEDIVKQWAFRTE